VLGGDEMSGEELGGLFFHGFDSQGRPVWQGIVIRRIHDDYYLVRLFSWLTGELTDMRLVPLSWMTGWRFYASEEQMKEAYERGPKHG